MQETKTPETLEMPEHLNVEIAVKNFGPIADATIDLQPLTVFVGPSNTGKTYFSTLIYALHGIFDGFAQLPSLLNSVGVNNLFSQSNTKSQSIRKKLNTLGNPFKFSDLPQEIRGIVQSAIEDSEGLNAELKRCFDLDSIRELIRLKEEQRNEMTVSLKVSREGQNLWDFNLESSKSDLRADGSVSEDAAFRLRERLTSKGKLDIKDLYIGLLVGLSGYTENRAYLPAARSGIMQSYRVITSALVKHATRGGLVPLEIPTFSGVVADFMQRLILYEESRIPKKEITGLAEVIASDRISRVTRLAEAIESDVLAGRIRMKPTPSGYPEFLYRPHEMGENVRLTRAASMVSELAPVVLFLRSGIQPGDLLIIEEPEAHLHPGAQTDIALTLAGLVRAGVRVVVTTHSDWLLKEIANLMRVGDLKRKGVTQVQEMAPTQWLLPEEVGTWWFQKDKSVQRIPFDPTEGIEPKDYEDVAYRLYDRSVNLQDLLEEVKKKGSEWV